MRITHHDVSVIWWTLFYSYIYPLQELVGAAKTLGILLEELHQNDTEGPKLDIQRTDLLLGDITEELPDNFEIKHASQRCRNYRASDIAVALNSRHAGDLLQDSVMLWEDNDDDELGDDGNDATTIKFPAIMGATGNVSSNFHPYSRMKPLFDEYCSLMDQKNEGAMHDVAE